MGGGSAPAGASGIPSNTLPAAMAYQPTAQPQSDIQLQSIFSGLQPTTQTYTGNAPQFTGLIFPDTPGGAAYAQAAGNYMGPGSITDASNPYLLQALGYANAMISPFSGLVDQLRGYTGAGSQSTQGAQDYANFISGLFPQAQGIGQNIISEAQQFPQWAQTVSGLANQLIPGAQSVINDPTAPALGHQLMSGAGQILQTGFDPQQALYNQLANQVSQQAQAANAAAGLGSSAYGTSQVGNTLSNFDINWQNQQLARQAQALGAAGPAGTTGETLTAAPYQLGGAISQGIANLLGQAGGLTTAGANLQNLGLGTLYNAGQQRFQSSQAPLQAAVAQTQALGQADQLLSQMAAQPYNMQSLAAGNAMNLLGQISNIGNQQFVIPQQLSNDLQSYLGLGQAASSLSGQLGALGQQESLQSMMGLGSALGAGSNLLFGNQGLSGALGLGSGGLLGGLGGGLGGGGIAVPGTGITDAAIASAGGLDIGSTGLAGAGIDASLAGGAGGGFASFAPLAFLGS